METILKKKNLFFFRSGSFRFFDESFPKSKNIYITEGYSIENECINFDVLKGVLEMFGKIDHAKIVILENQFTINLNIFRKVMTPIMIQILLWRKQGKNPCLNNINMKDFFSFSEESLLILSDKFKNIGYRINHVGKLLNLLPSSQADLIVAEKEFLLKGGVEKFIRGKYLLWFFIQFINASCRFLNLKQKHSLSVNNGMVIIAPIIRCPNSLRQFIRKNYKKYIIRRKLIASINLAFLIKSRKRTF